MSDREESLSQELSRESLVKMFRKTIEKMGLDKDLKSTNTYVYRYALVLLLHSHRDTVEEMDDLHLKETLAAAIGRDQHAQRITPALEIVKAWAARAKKLATNKLKRLIKTES
jgi:hypothetical protein